MALIINGGTTITGGITLLSQSGDSVPVVPTSTAPFAGVESYYFDGLGQHLTYNAQPLAVDTDWTVEWFQRENDTNTFPRPFMTTNGWGVSVEGGGPASFYFWSPGPNALTTTGISKDNTWHHVALSTISGTLTLYIDGVSSGTVSGLSAYSFTGEELWVGAKPGGMSSESFGGWITNFRWTVGVGVYTGNFTVPSSRLGLTQSAGTNIQAITSGQVKLFLEPGQEYAA